jgi:hypothetical protein
MDQRYGDIRGTTLTQMMCSLEVFGEPELPAPLGELSLWLDQGIGAVDEVRRRLSAQQHRRIIKTHPHWTDCRSESASSTWWWDGTRSMSPCRCGITCASH